MRRILYETSFVSQVGHKEGSVHKGVKITFSAVMSNAPTAPQ
jgi:hypothetical protein